MEEIWPLIAIGLIAVLAGFVHSAIGFGFGIVAISLTPFVIDAKNAHIVISTASVPVIAMAAWTYRKGSDKKSLVQSLIGAAVCLPLGLWLFYHFDLSWLVRATGVAILAMVVLSYRNRKLAKSKEKTAGGSALVAGGVGGFLAGAVTIAGPPVAAFALQQSWSQDHFKAYLNQFLFAVAGLKVIGLLWAGSIDGAVLLRALVIAPLAIIGIRIGAAFSERLSGGWFQNLVAVALIAVALKFLVLG